MSAISGHNDTSIDVKSYYGVCLDVLDIVYIQRADVYGQLYHIATGRSVLSDKDRSSPQHSRSPSTDDSP